MNVRELISFVEASRDLKHSGDRDVFAWCHLRHQPAPLENVTFRADGTVDLWPEEPPAVVISDLVDNLGRLLWENIPCDSGTDPPDVEMLRPAVIAMLRQMREPAEGIVDAGVAASPEEYGSLATSIPISGERVKVIWQSMIDAALAQK